MFVVLYATDGMGWILFYEVRGILVKSMVFVSEDWMINNYLNLWFVSCKVKN